MAASPKPSPKLRSQRVFSTDGMEGALTSPALPGAVPLFPSHDRFMLDGTTPVEATSANSATSTSSSATSAANVTASPVSIATVTQMSSGSTSDLLRARIPVLQKKDHTAAVFTSGRPPWYSQDGQVKEAFLIGCAGGSASGKTTVAEHIIEQLDVPWVVLLSMDSFYKSLTPEQKAQAHRSEYNFDCPEAFDYPLLKETLQLIKAGKQVEIPVYDFTTHSRTAETTTMYGANVVVFEGIFGLYDDEINEMMDMRIFVDTDDDVRLARRLKRDIAERGRDLVGVIQQYNKFVKPAFDKYIRPCINKAHVIIPRGGDNIVAIDVISKHIKRMLEVRGVKFRKQLAAINKDSALPSSALHTIIRNQNTNRDDFIFYSQRLFRLMVEEALSMLPFEKTVIETPTGCTYEGTRLAGEIFGVSIVRAGVALENALHDVCKDAKIGKILIQTDIRTGEPQLHYNSLPRSIARGHVLLLDATIASGAAALMAIRVLKDHHVPEENIIFVALIAAPQGVHAIAYAFPKVKVVVSEIDEGLNEQFHIVPGIGNFGDRFYGTD